jgi:hypothetical protein
MKLFQLSKNINIFYIITFVIKNNIKIMKHTSLPNVISDIFLNYFDVIFN